MHRSNDCFLLFGLAMAVLVLSGCGDSTPVLDTEPVEGVVTLDGEPVPEATGRQPLRHGEVGSAGAGLPDQKGDRGNLLVPPFNEDDTVNYDMLRKLVGFHAENHSTG
ncbi:MAG: hypothetical protein R6U98_17620, partial [Pirellulaceae bacterium]